MKPSFLKSYKKTLSRPVVYSSLIILALLASAFVLPISLNWTIDAPCKVLPAREWLLTKNEEGGVLATLSDYLQGSVENYAVLSIVRGDAFRFDVISSLKPGDPLSAGDTVVKIFSHELAREFYRLSGELVVAKSSLAMMKSGEKEAITEEAERALSLAKERAGVQQQIFARQDSLYKRNLISPEEFELARSAAQTTAIEVAIAEARLQTVQTGAKPEQIRLIESQIASLEAQMRALSRQVGALTLVSPFSGTFQSTPGTDTMLTVEDTARVILMPIPIKHLARIAPGQLVKVRIPRQRESYEGAVVRVDQRVRIVNGAQVVMAVATLNGRVKSLPTNLIGIGSIQTDHLSPAQYLRYWISDILVEISDGTIRI
jgi:hypothetical protein